MPKVLIQPSGLELEVPKGTSLMQAARDQGYYWPTQCDMECRCATCFVIVEAGADHLSAMGRAEAATLQEQRGRNALDQPVRLACQVLVHADVVVRKHGVRPIDTPTI